MVYFRINAKIVVTMNEYARTANAPTAWRHS